MDTIKVELIENVPTIRKKFEQREKLLLSHFWITHTFAACETLCARRIIGICFLNMLMEGRCSTI